MIIGDSAYPPASYPTAWNGLPVVGWCVYIGGDTPHPWTATEIATLRAQPHIRYILPIFTRSNPVGAAQAVADAAVAIAWAKTYGQPRGTLTMVDYETAQNSAYEQQFDKSLRAGDGDLEILYGSKGNVLANAAPSGGYDEAAWTGADYAPTSTADQFVDVGAYDLDDFATSAPLWDIRATPAITKEFIVSGFIASIAPSGNQNPGVWVWLDGHYVGMTSQPDASAIGTALGLPTVTLSLGTHLNLLAATQPGTGSGATPQQVASAVLGAEGAADTAAAKA